MRPRITRRSLVKLSALTGLGGWLGLGLPGRADAQVRRVPYTGLALTPSGHGLWTLDQMGRVVAFGDAPDLVSPPDPVNELFVALAALPSGEGAYALTKRGHIRGFGDARAFDAVEISETIPCVMPMPFVDLALTPTGNGLWVLDQMGGVFALGDAPDLTAPPDPVKELFVALAALPSGEGAYALTKRGHIRGFGDARAFDAVEISEAIPCIMPMPFVDLALTPTGNGLWVLDQMGGVFALGDAPDLIAPPDPVKEIFVGIGATPTGRGLFALSQHGDVVLFGDAELHTRDVIPCV